MDNGWFNPDDASLIREMIVGGEYARIARLHQTVLERVEALTKGTRRARPVPPQAPELTAGDWVKPSVAADFYQRSPRTIGRWIKEGKLKTKRLPSGAELVQIERTTAVDVDSVMAGRKTVRKPS